MRPRSNRIVLVTGGAGFIGSRVSEKLIQTGHHVRIFDNLRNGNISNLTAVLDEVDFFRGDTRDFKAVTEACRNVDAVVHLAALTDVSESFNKPKLYQDVNGIGTKNVLEACQKSALKFILASSCAVYGNPAKTPSREDDPFSPRSPYAKSKIEAERFCQLSESNQMNTIILRLFNVYGPRNIRNRHLGVINSIIKNIQENRPPLIFGNGRQTRDFVYIDDVVDAIMLCLKKPIAGIFNIGTGVPVTVNRLAKLISSLLNAEYLRPIHTGPHPGDIRRSVADVNRAHWILGFSPHISLEEGLRMTTGRHA